MFKTKFLIFVLTLMFASGVAANAGGCAYGISIWHNFSIGECEYKANFCVECNATNPSKFYFKYLVKIDGGCAGDFNEANDYVDSLLNEPAFLNTLCGLPGPCQSAPKPYEVIRPMCWKKTNTEGSIVYSQCEGTAVCKTPWGLCWDGAQFVIDYGTSTIEGSFSCFGATEPDDPEEEETTGCFYAVTPCNP